MVLTILGILFLVVGILLIFIGFKIKGNSSSSGPMFFGSTATPEIRSLYNNNYYRPNIGKVPIIVGTISIIIAMIFFSIARIHSV